jgi:hypothetical protein
VIAQEIVDDLEAALEQFRLIAADLNGGIADADLDQDRRSGDALRKTARAATPRQRRNGVRPLHRPRPRVHHGRATGTSPCTEAGARTGCLLGSRVDLEVD